MRRYPVILVAALGIACEQAPKAATTPAPGSGPAVTFGFFTSGNAQLSYRLDVPAHTAPVRAVVFGHGSGMQTHVVYSGLGHSFPLASADIDKWLAQIGQ